MTDGTLTFSTALDTAGFSKSLYSMQMMAATGMGGAAMSGAEIGKKILKWIGTQFLSNLFDQAIDDISGSEKEADKKQDEFDEKSKETVTKLIAAQELVDKTFESSSYKIHQWSKEAQDAYGMSELQAMKFYGEMGVTLRAMGLTSDQAADMSRHLIGLTSDVASFYQLDHEDAFMMIRNGISGDERALQNYNIVMDESNLNTFAMASGLKKTYAEMSAGERAIIRMHYLLAEASDIQNDYSKSTESVTNQQKKSNAVAENSLIAFGKFQMGITNPKENGFTWELNEIIKGLGNTDSALENTKKIYNETIRGMGEKSIESLHLLDEYGTLFDAQGQKDVDRLKEISATLLENYPQLSDVIKNNFLTTDTETVKALIAQLADEQQQKANAIYAASIQEQRIQSKEDLDSLKCIIEAEQERISELEGKRVELERVIAQAEMLGSVSIDASIKDGQGNVISDGSGEIQARLQLLKDFYTTMEGFGNLDISNVKELDLNNLMNLTSDDVKAGTEASRELQKLIQQISLMEPTAFNDAFDSFENERLVCEENLKNAKGAQEQAQLDYESLNDIWTKANAEFKEKFGINVDEYVAGTDDIKNSSSDTASQLQEDMDKLNENSQILNDTQGQISDAKADAALLQGNQQATIGELEAQALTVEQLAANIQVAQEAGATAQADLAARKETVVADAQAILTSMNDLIAALALDVDTMVTTMNTIVTNGEVGAATAGNAFAQGAGDGYRANTALRDAVGASAQQSLAALNSYANAFETAGSGLVGSIASGVAGNASALSDAVRDAVRGALAAAQSAFSGNSVFRTASRYYPHRTGLEYVPYDEYPALLHKGESVLTASEAALWRGGLYVREPGAARVDYDALAAAIWRGAPPEGGLAISVNLDGEEVANVLEPSISALQGRRLALQRR